MARGYGEKKSDKKKILIEAIDRFQISEDAERSMRVEAMEADRFANGDQWDNGIQNDRTLQRRPCLTINKTAPAIRQVTNDARKHRPQVHVYPTADGTEKTANLLEGAVRHIQVDSHSDIAIDEAFQQQVTGGWGYFRVLTEYTSDDSFEQELKIKRIKNRFSVYADPFCLEPDYSDARWYFIIEDVPTSEFKKMYPNATETTQVMGGTDTDKTWISEDSIRVAEYWCVKEERSELHELEDGTIISADEYNAAKKNPNITEDIPPIKRSREVIERKVMCYKMTAAEVIDEYEWLGKYIPIIPVIGEDREINGTRTVRGMTYSMMDSQRQYNYWTSAATETIALAPKAPWLLAEGQQEGYEQDWAQANSGTPAYLVYKSTTVAGQPVPPPSRITAEPPIQAMTMAIRQASDDMKSVSGIYDASMGARSNETSGKAILARQAEGDNANFHFIDNLSRSLRFLGAVLLDLIPKIYDTQRLVRITHENGDEETVEVNKHLDPNISPEQLMQMKAKAENGEDEILDITAMKYDVIVQTGASYATKRMETAEAMIQISQAYPALWQVAGDMMVKNMDWPNAQQLAERLKKTPTIAQLTADEGEGAVPPQVQQQMQQAQQMIEQLTQALNEAQDKIDGKEMEINSKEKIATMNNSTQLTIAALQNEMRNNMALFKEELNHLRAIQQQTFQKEAQEQKMQQVDMGAGHGGMPPT